MKTDKKIMAGSLFFLLFSSMAVAGTSQFAGFSKSILAIKARPGYSVERTRIIVLHPLVKDRETILVHESQLNCGPDKCVKKFIKSRQLKGKKAKGSIVGKTVTSYYLPKKLKEYLTTGIISNWEKSSSLKLDKKPSHGYSFNVIVKGEKRNGEIHLNADGSLKAIALMFPKQGISHARTMKDSGTVWYFSGKGKSLKLVKSYKMTTQKKSGIPFIKILTTTYSKF